MKFTYLLFTIFVFKSPKPLLSCDLDGLSICGCVLYNPLYIPRFSTHVGKKTDYDADINPFNSGMPH
jgi:hypothetical protein